MKALYTLIILLIPFVGFGQEKLIIKSHEINMKEIDDKIANYLEELGDDLLGKQIMWVDQYEIFLNDSILNVYWGYIKSIMSDKTYSEILKSQRKWLEMKENTKNYYASLYEEASNSHLHFYTDYRESMILMYENRNKELYNIIKTLNAGQNEFNNKKETKIIDYGEVYYEQQDENFIFYINYLNDFDGYKVKIEFTPKKHYYSVIGHAKIFLTNSKTSQLQIIEIDSYRLSKNYWDKLYKSNEIDVEWEIENDPSTFANIANSFFFMDIDFDGKNELILRYANGCQRFYDCIDVYSLEAIDGVGFSWIESYSFDDGTHIDLKERKLTQQNSNGACSSNLNEYLFIEGIWTLKYITEYVIENNKCYECYYEILNDNTKNLIRKILMSN